MKPDYKDLISRAAGKLLRPLGLVVVSQSRVDAFQKRTCMERLRLAVKNGFAPHTILDGGAFKGLWTQQAASLFPGAQFILVEPNPAMQPFIEKNISQINPAPILVQAALGEVKQSGQLHLWHDPAEDAGASLLEHVSGPARQALPVEITTIDSIAQEHGLIPDLLKLDLQGAELAALQGSVETLKHAEMAVIEFGCLNAYIDRTTPRDLLDLMFDSDYCLYDVVGLADRPYDGALTGGDFIFVKNDSPLRAYKGWA